MKFDENLINLYHTMIYKDNKFEYDNSIG